MLGTKGIFSSFRFIAVVQIMHVHRYIDENPKTSFPNIAKPYANTASTIFML